MAAVALRDRDHEPQVRVDHPLLRDEVAPLDALGEGDLVGGGEQLVAADLVEEELQAVGGDTARGGRQVQVEAVVGVRRLVLDQDLGLGQGGAEVLDGLVVEVVLERERLDLVGSNGASLLRLLQEGGKRDVMGVGVRAQGKFSRH